LLAAPPALPDRFDHGGRHVLLISIDGMHALDYENCLGANTCPNLKGLGKTGVNFTRTSTSRPSDSFPGLMAIVTGGTPKTVGAWYDVAYDRVLAPPINTTGNGVLGGTCTPGQVNGTRTEYEEGVDIDQSKLTGGSPLYTNPIDGGFLSIDPSKLPRDPYNGCKPVYPWNFIRANTIYGVIHEAGGYTAWADKHAVYAAVSGPTGTSTPSNVDDYYAPDVNSDVVPLPGITTASGVNCATIPINGAWTDGFDSVKCNDQLKVNAVLNWISGKTHLGESNTRVPVIFGMNFQAVSVGQKLIAGGMKGGYTDAAGTPTPAMLAEIEYVDAAIGQMVTALSKADLLDSTTLIITAKHGQSPIDTHRFFPIPGSGGANGTPPLRCSGRHIFLIPRSTRSVPPRTIFHFCGSNREQIRFPRSTFSKATRPQRASDRSSTGRPSGPPTTRQGCLLTSTLARLTSSCSRTQAWSTPAVRKNSPSTADFLRTIRT